MNMSSTSEWYREEVREPKEVSRIAYAKERLERLGYEVTEIGDNKSLVFFHNGHRITFYPYKGWFSGKGIKDGRGIETLIKRLNHGKRTTIPNGSGNNIKGPESV